MENTSDYLSDTLFHFWGKGMDEQGQLKVFDSVIQNGLLLTCGNKDFIDQFQYYRYSSKQVERIRLKQWARVCFTEVPRDKLSIIQEKFGSFGIGFSRKIILQWGGCPVWYLPNYYEQETQYGRVAISLTNLIQLIDLLQSMKDKEISLTIKEKEALIYAIPSWAQPYQTGIPKIDKSLPNHPIIDDFFWFNGIPELNTVAEAIKQIIVPTKSLFQRVNDYIQSHKNLFGKDLPTVELM